MAARDPDDSLKAQHSSDVLLIQFVTVQQCLNGINAVLLVGDPCVDAVVVVQKEAGLFCTQCSQQRSCQHVRAVQGNAVAETSSMEAKQQAWLQKFESVFDNETGRRRVTSISQARLNGMVTCQ